MSTPKFVFVDFGGTADLVISEMAYVHIFHPNEEGFENPEYRQKLEQWMAENNVARISYDAAMHSESDNEASGMIDCPILDLSDTQRSVTVHFKEKEVEGEMGVDQFLRRYAIDTLFNNTKIREDFQALADKYAEGQQHHMPKVQYLNVILNAVEVYIEEGHHEEVPAGTNVGMFVGLAVALGLDPEYWDFDGNEEEVQMMEDLAEFVNNLNNTQIA